MRRRDQRRLPGSEQSPDAQSRSNLSILGQCCGSEQIGAWCSSVRTRSTVGNFSGEGRIAVSSASLGVMFIAARHQMSFPRFSGLVMGSHTDQPQRPEPRYARPLKRRRARRHRKVADAFPSQVRGVLIEARVADFRRVVAVADNLERRQGEPRQPAAGERSLTLRFASPADERPLARLAALDSSKPPAQPVLLAEVDGQLHGALGLSDGTVVADPFHPTADLIDLLRARARHLESDRRMTRSGRLRSRSRLRAPALR